MVRSTKEKRCPFCGKKLGEYPDKKSKEFADQHFPIKVKCPRCKRIS
jgi:phage FluMu protein Com